MTRDEIIAAAKESGFNLLTDGIRDNGKLSNYLDCLPEELERFATLIINATLEAAAVKCKELHRNSRGEQYDFLGKDLAQNCAAAIRSMKT